MEITIHVSGPLAQALRQEDQSDAEWGELTRTIAALNARLEPLPPGIGEPESPSTVAVEVPDTVDSAEAVDRLRQCSGVESAYLKPSAEPPSGPPP